MNYDTETIFGAAVTKAMQAEGTDIPPEMINRYANQWKYMLLGPIVTALLEEHDSKIDYLKGMNVPTDACLSDKSKAEAYILKRLESEMPVENFVRSRYLQDKLIRKYIYELENLTLSPEESEDIKCKIYMINGNASKMMNHMNYLRDEFLKLGIRKHESLLDDVKKEEDYETAGEIAEKLKKLNAELDDIRKSR
jgi:hypothetical protein